MILRGRSTSLGRPLLDLVYGNAYAVGKLEVFQVGRFMRGRKPKPVEVHALNGNPSKKKHLAEQKKKSELLSSLAEAPPASLNSYAKEFWLLIWAELRELEMLKALDAPMLELLCHALGDAREAREMMQIEGKTVATETGFTVSPWYRIFKSSFEIATKLSLEFGLTQTARARLLSAITAKEPVENPLSKYMRRPLHDEKGKGLH